MYVHPLILPLLCFVFTPLCHPLLYRLLSPYLSPSFTLIYLVHWLLLLLSIYSPHMQSTTLALVSSSLLLLLFKDTNFCFVLSLLLADYIGESVQNPVLVLQRCNGIGSGQQRLAWADQPHQGKALCLQVYHLLSSFTLS